MSWPDSRRDGRSRERVTIFDGEHCRRKPLPPAFADNVRALAPTYRQSARYGTVSTVLAPGTPAPSFTLPDQNGNSVSLSDFKGSWLLLWWYPKAATPG